MTALDLSLIPPLGEPRPQPVPEVTETVLPSGLRVVVVPRPGVPLVELRLRVPFAATSARSAATHTARTAVLSGAVLLGTAMIAATAAGIYRSLPAAGAAMQQPGRPRAPNPKAAARFDRDYRVLLEMQRQRQALDRMQ